MRERIQRAKIVGTDIWVEGYYVHQYDSDMIYFPDGLDEDGFDYRCINKDTLGDYTGVMDKNRTRIFEGDIVRIDKYVKEMFKIRDGSIIYGRGGFYINNFDTLNSLCAIASFDGVLRGEVVGNVHDNPELLEGN